MADLLMHVTGVAQAAPGVMGRLGWGITAWLLLNALLVAWRLR